jgi:hypothetical protein
VVNPHREGRTVPDTELVLTIPEVAQELGESHWTVRRVVDALGLPVPRAGRSLYRLVPRTWLPKIRVALAAREARLKRRADVPKEEVAES